MRPLPLQVLQVSSSVPDFAPVPLQREHVETFAMRTLRVVPKTASLNGTSRSMEMSRPLGVRACALLPPPKISPKISPKSNSTPPLPKPWPKPLKSNPPNPEGPDAPAEGRPPPANAWPYESYSRRFRSSLKTEYASVISL